MPDVFAPGAPSVITDDVDEVSADVVIVGSGVGGATLAWALRESGARVLVLEVGGFLPRELENWSPRSVFVENRYKNSDRWLDTVEHRAFVPGNGLYPVYVDTRLCREGCYLGDVPGILLVSNSRGSSGAERCCSTPRRPLDGPGRATAGCGSALSCTWRRRTRPRVQYPSTWEVYCEPRSLWKITPGGGRRWVIAISNASVIKGM